jgi:hypothetical protein
MRLPFHRFNRAKSIHEEKLNRVFNTGYLLLKSLNTEPEIKDPIKTINIQQDLEKGIKILFNTKTRGIDCCKLLNRRSTCLWKIPASRFVKTLVTSLNMYVLVVTKIQLHFL